MSPTPEKTTARDTRTARAARFLASAKRHDVLAAEYRAKAKALTDGVAADKAQAEAES